MSLLSWVNWEPSYNVKATVPFPLPSVFTFMPSQRLILGWQKVLGAMVFCVPGGEAPLAISIMASSCILGPALVAQGDLGGLVARQWLVP